MSEFINLLLAMSVKFGYFGIISLMAIESSFIPFPSEVVIPPAAYLASKGEFSIYLVIFSGILGSVIGAVINYFLALTLGRKVIFLLADTKIAKLLLINSKKIEKSEKIFLKYGGFSTFFGRLVPAVRQLISIPAGFSKMNIKKFIFFTACGSGLWTVILAGLGYFFGANNDLLMRYYKEVVIIAVVIVIIAILIKIKLIKTKKFKLLFSKIINK